MKLTPQVKQYPDVFDDKLHWIPACAVVKLTSWHQLAKQLSNQPPTERIQYKKDLIKTVNSFKKDS